MYYSKMFADKNGLTNQVFSLITSIIIAYKNNHKVVIVDYFLNDYSKNTYTSISHIFNIDKLNIFLKKEYDIILIDKYDINFNLCSIKYGTQTKNIDLTDIIKEKYYKNNILLIKKDINLNDLKGDPYYGVNKELFLNYEINNYLIKEKYEEVLKEDINIDFLNSNYIHTFEWINKFNANMFENILVHIDYDNSLIEKSQNIFKNISENNKINIIHLRLEDDAIEYWSKINNMTEQKFKTYIENKYIQIIKKYISNNDENIILSQSLSNKVIDFLIEKKYNYKISDKYFEDREKNAIVDLLISKKCNNIFIGNFNFKNLNGSTFSYYIGKLLDNNVNNNVKKVCIDLDKITDDECIS